MQCTARMDQFRADLRTAMERGELLFLLNLQDETTRQERLAKLDAKQRQQLVYAALFTAQEIALNAAKEALTQN